ncbi:hypothetical protein J7L05_02405 [bacterium]|nr:hypothetical protein [bacterium]
MAHVELHFKLIIHEGDSLWVEDKVLDKVEDRELDQEVNAYVHHAKR